MTEQPAPAPNLSSPAKARSWLGKLWNWFKAASWKQKLIFFVILLGVLIVIFELVFLAYLTYKSVTSDDLALFLQTSNSTLVLKHGEQANITFTLGTRNLAFCTAKCEWSVDEADTAAILANGSQELTRNQQTMRTMQVTAPRVGESVIPYQIQATCQNKQSYYCRSAGEVKRAATVVVVNTTYTDQEQLSHDELAAGLASWKADAQALLSADEGIAGLNDSRIPVTKALASTEKQAIEDAIARIAAALAADDVNSADAALHEQLANQSLASYSAAQQLEAALVQAYSGLLSQQPVMSALLSVANTSDAQALLASVQQANQGHDLFYQQSLDETEAAFNGLNDTIGVLASIYNDTTAEADAGGQLLHDELLMACTIKAGKCPENTTSSTTIVVAVQSLRDTCSQLAAINDTFANYSAAYGELLNSTATLQEVELQYNVQAIRLEPGFANASELALAAGRSGNLSDNNATIRLAVQLQVSNTTAEFMREHCKLNNYTANLAADTLQPVLPASPSTPVVPAQLSLPQQQCCGLGACNACSQQHRYPVVFVHGHSFAASTSPEDDLDAFTAMVFELQNSNYLYAGHAFPAADLNSIPELFSSVPGGISFTATYYYNSYPEKGSLAFIPQKSENIETYSIRLKEAIDLVKRETGSDKVVLVAHSMGGLVARSYMQIFGDSDVASLVMIATPNHGISGSTATLCPVFGGKTECQDMDAGSVFLDKLNNGQQPAVPVYTIAGTGCSGSSDGVVTTDEVQLSYATNYVVNGTCPDPNHLLHSTMLDPLAHPEVYSIVKQIVDKYTR